MRRLPLLLGLLLPLAAGAQVEDVTAEGLLLEGPPVPPGIRFHALVQELRDATLEGEPELATALGEPVAQDRWRDLSPAATSRRDGETARFLETLMTIPVGELPEEDRLDAELLRRRLENAAAGRRFPDELLAISQLDGPQHLVPETLAAMPRLTAADLEDVLARLAALPRLVDQTVVLLGRGLTLGVTPPKVALRDVPQQVLGLVPEDPFESPLLLPFQEPSPSLPAAEGERLRKRAAAVYRAAARPAFEKLHRYLTVTYIPAARSSTALADLPDGAAWYAWLLERATGSPELGARELHDLGRHEVERLRAEMEEATLAAGFRGDYESFVELMRTHSGFFFQGEDEMLDTYRDLAQRVDGSLLELFGLLPRLPYGVEPLPGRVARSAPDAVYQPGSLETGRAAFLLLNTFDLASRPRWRAPSLVLREVVGHHVEDALVGERRDLPWFRRDDAFPAFEAGWALYAEGLGAELHFYDDPYDRLGALTSELWQALLLVADTGIHAFGWSRQRAIDYLYENAGRPEHEAIVEVDRILVHPGRAAAAEVGELALRNLRRRAEEALGERFDPRAFHDAVLAAGPLPLDVLERRIDAWIAGSR